MKKLKVWLLTLVSVMAIVCCLAACGSSSKAGTYKIASMTIAGTEYKVGDEIPVLGKLADDYVTITLNEDGTCEMVAKMVGTEIKTEGTWKENADDSNKIDMTVRKHANACLRRFHHFDGNERQLGCIEEISDL